MSAKGESIFCVPKFDFALDADDFGCDPFRGVIGGLGLIVVGFADWTGCFAGVFVVFCVLCVVFVDFSWGFEGGVPGFRGGGDPAFLDLAVVLGVG